MYVGESTEAETQRREAARAVVRALAECGDLDEAAPRILDAVCRNLGMSSGALWSVRGPGIADLHCLAGWEATSGGALTACAAPAGNEPMRRACLAGEIAFELAARRPGEVVLAVPARARSGVVALVELRGATADPPDADLLAWLEMLGGQIGEFVRRAQAEADARLLRVTLDASSDPLYLVDPDEMRYVYVNEAACRVAGLTREAHLELAPWKPSGTTREALQALYAELITKKGEMATSEIFGIKADGDRGWFEVQRRALRLGARWMILANSREVTQRKLAEDAALRHGRTYAALSATNEAIMRVGSVTELYQRVCDAAVNGGKMISASVLLKTDSAWMQVAAVSGGGQRRLRETRISVDEATPEGRGLVGTAYRTGKPCVSNDFLKDERTRLWHAVAGKAGIRSGAAVPFRSHDGVAGVLLLYSAERRAFDDEAVKLLGRMTDNIAFALENFERDRERQQAQLRIEYLANHDVLTGLPNRAMFGHLLHHALEAARRYARGLAVLFIDLDGFKVINDTLGHEAGDRLLQRIAARLRQTLRSSDVVARLGGDEFVVLLEEVPEPAQVSAVARKILAAVAEPVALAEQECCVTASIGVSMYPLDAADEHALMKNADIAMYLAKDQGKNNFQIYSEELRTQRTEKLTLERALRQALDRGEFSLHYQAKQGLRSGAITGVEALLRWTSAQFGEVPPSRFIPLAEETGLIGPIGAWVLRTACAQNVAWLREGLPPVRVAVNLSARQFADPELLATVAAALRDSGMAAELLEIEITESMVMRDADRAVQQLRALKDMGVTVAVDDFGTGYSSLALLKRFPIDTLKIDRSFIREVPGDAEGQAIAEAILAMARTLRLTVVAEGVETVEQRAFLREHGCDEVQGYLFSRPVPAQQFADLLRTSLGLPSAG